MNWGLVRVMVVALLGAAAALAFTWAAATPYNPRLEVGTAAGVNLVFTQAANDTPTAKVVFYVPNGVASKLNQKVGATIGSASARATLADNGNAVARLNGAVTVQDANLHTKNTCARGKHQAVWATTLAAGGSAIAVVVFYVDPLAGTPEAPYGALKIQACFAAPDVAPGTPGRAVQGAKITRLALRLQGVLTPPASGELRWSGLFTPFKAGTGRASTAETVESQVITRTPIRATLAGKALKKRALLSGRVLSGGKPVAGARVDLVAGRRIVASARTNATGRFRSSVRLRRTTRFHANVTADLRAVAKASCVPAIAVTPKITAKCVSVSLAGFATRTRTIRVKLKA